MNKTDRRSVEVFLDRRAGLDSHPRIGGSPAVDRKKTSVTEQRNDRPGYKYRPKADGSRAHYWVPQRASKRAPGALQPRAITDDLVADMMAQHSDLTTADDAIAKLCRTWTDELLADLDDRGSKTDYDGTVGSAVMIHRTRVTGVSLP